MNTRLFLAIFMCTVLVSSLVLAEEMAVKKTGALPTEGPRYMLKRAVEAVDLFLTFSPTDKANKALFYAEVRQKELTANKSLTPDQYNSLQTDFESKLGIAESNAPEEVKYAVLTKANLLRMTHLVRLEAQQQKLIDMGVQSNGLSNIISKTELLLETKLANYTGIINASPLTPGELPPIMLPDNGTFTGNTEHVCDKIEKDAIAGKISQDEARNRLRPLGCIENDTKVPIVVPVNSSVPPLCGQVQCYIDWCPGEHIADESGCTSCASPCKNGTTISKTCTEPERQCSNWQGCINGVMSRICVGSCMPRSIEQASCNPNECHLMCGPVYTTMVYPSSGTQPCISDCYGPVVQYDNVTVTRQARGIAIHMK